MDVLPATLGAMFLLGLAGGVHCVGMCGGIVTAIALAPATSSSNAAASSSVPASPRPVIPIRASAPARRPTILLAYNAGRIGTYAFAGALVGMLGSLTLYANALLPVQRAMYVAVSLMLVLTGLHLAGVTRVLAFAESAGAVLWRRLQPLTRGFLPATTPSRAVAAGALWGWVPCGLVYSALLPALASGDPARGAAMMAAFGAGTLPWLLAGGALAGRLARWRATPRGRQVLGAAIALLGSVGLAHMAHASGAIEHVLAICFTR